MKIELKNCSKLYQKDNCLYYALKDFSYTFVDKRFYAIMGPSGSGKSTLINIMSGLLKKSEGEILYNNIPITKNSDWVKIRKNKISLVYQSYLLSEDMTALENVTLPLYLTKMSNKDRIRNAKNKLTELGLGKKLNHYPKELSGGEQQRVAIARALITNPDIIIADEPTGNLDKKNEEYIFHLLKNLSNKGKCIIVASHNEKIKKYATDILNIKEGKLNEKK